jgi:micrococcal nuclease
MRRFLAVVAASAVLVAHIAAQTFTGRVVGVADGDTVTVLVEHAGGRKEQVKVRLHGIDAPEAKQAFGSRSKESLSDLVAGKTVTVQQTDKDRYGRVVAVLLVAGKNVNIEQVRLGMAWWYRQYAKTDKQLEQAEAEARRAKRGLWVDPSPVPPWEFRRQ